MLGGQGKGWKKSLEMVWADRVKILKHHEGCEVWHWHAAIQCISWVCLSHIVGRGVKDMLESCAKLPLERVNKYDV